MTRLNGTLSRFKTNGFAEESIVRLAPAMFGRARKLATAGSLAFALVFVAGAAAQQDSPTAPNSNNIMGFEANGTWIVTGNSSPPGFSAGITTNRTQGSAAYAVANPPNQVKITSQPIASTATALAGIGDNGALLQIDVLIPLQQGNTVNSGYIQPYVSSRSRGLSKVPLTQVFFNSYREGIYSTIAFPLPNAVGSALKGATFSDLTFEFDISSPGKITGAYLLDNLRVHSVTLVQSPTSDTPIPPGYGGSVDLLAYGDAPATQTFPIGPTQIPLGFQFTKLIDKASPKLFLGLDGKPTTTCTYDPDPNDSTMLRYVLNTCDNGFKAGDLINANWVSLAIIGGDATDKLRAQLALNPMGDLTGAGIIPPMPTFWGTAYSCIPAPVAGKVVTTSTSCAAQTAQANQIMKQYFTQLKNANPPPNWIVPPVPSFALRHGDGTPNNNLLGVPPPPNDPPFDSGGDLNPGGSFDAYWRLNGNLTPTPPVTGSDETKTHFDAAFTAHGVLFGEDVDVVDAKVVADTDSGRTTPLPAIAATSTGTLAFYVFGVELPSGQDLTISPSTGFSIDPKWSQEYNLPPIQIWIFTVTLGATADAEFMATGSAALAGVDLNLLPSASLGGHVSGGINLGIASGSVDAKVNLVKVSTPVTAQAKWVIDTRPQVCSATLDGHLKGDLDLSSGGGEVDLKATFGFCPFCDTESETLVKWGPLASSTLKLFDDTIDVQLFGLPASLCAFPVTATINSPVPAATLSSGLPITLTGTAAPTDSTIPVSSTTYAWTYTPGTNASGSTASVNTMGATGPNPRVTFPAPTSGTTSAWTIGMTATVSTTSAGGTVVTSTASATPVTVSVSSLTSGAYITQVSGDVSGLAIPDAAGVFVLPMMSNAPPGESGIFTTGTVTVSGVVVGGSGSLNTTFNISTCNDIDSNGYTATCSCPSPFTATTCPSGSTPLTTANPTTNTPSATSPALQSGTYKITIHTTSGGSDFGIPTSVLVWVPQPIV